MPFITAENASAIARKRWDNPASRTKLEIASPEQYARAILEPNLARAIESMLKIVDEQIASARAELNAEPAAFCEHCKQGGAMPGSHRAAMLRALDGLIERKAKLLGIPDPGSLKPTGKGMRPSWSPSVVSMPAPAPLTPQQVASAPDSSVTPVDEHKP